MLKDVVESQSPIHTRDISFRTFPAEGDRVIVQGELKDYRYVPVFDITGQVREPGVIHHMRLFCLVAPEPLRILKAEADMPTVPMAECRTCLDRVPPLEGMEIRPGFTRRIDELMGKTRGCTHFCGLVKAMAQEMVHGWLTRKRREKTVLPRRIEDIKEKAFLVNSCRIWKEDGPRVKLFAKVMQEAIDAQNASQGSGVSGA